MSPTDPTFTIGQRVVDTIGVEDMRPPGANHRAYRMFCGELDGALVLIYIRHRKWEVAAAISRMFPGKGRDEQWSAAKQAGWRVVPVIIRAAEGASPGRKDMIANYYLAITGDSA